jgi:hypothetical protein
MRCNDQSVRLQRAQRAVRLNKNQFSDAYKKCDHGGAKINVVDR